MTLALVKNINNYRNLDLETLQGDFVQSFLNTYKSEDTQRAYKHDILEFFSVKQTDHITLSSLQSLTAKQALDYLYSIVNKGNSKATIDRKVAAMKSLIDYVNFLGTSCNIYISNIFENKFLKKSVITQSNKENKEIDTFKPHEIRHLITVTKEKAKIPQHYVVIKLLFNSMARRDEIVNIYPEHIFQVTNKEGEIEYGLKLFGKGRKERNIYISNEMKELLDSISFAKGCPVFNYTADNIYKILNKYCRMAGIVKEKISPHIARHSSITIASENGGDIKDIQNTAGHSKQQTTEGYIHAGQKFEKCATRLTQF